MGGDRAEEGVAFLPRVGLDRGSPVLPVGLGGVEARDKLGPDTSRGEPCSNNSDCDIPLSVVARILVCRILDEIHLDQEGAGVRGSPVCDSHGEHVAGVAVRVAGGSKIVVRVV